MRLFPFLLINYFFLVRTLRWLSLWQQKEYRFDRLKAFLQTPQGKSELKTLFTFPHKKSQLKRPKFTPKAFLIFLSTLITLLIFDSFITIIFNNPITILITYTLIPLVIVLTSLPFNLITLLFSFYYQFKSAQLIKKHNPTIIGITGSFGKTTTKILTAHLLSARFNVWYSPKSFNTPLSLPKSFAKTYQGQEIVVIEFAAYKMGEIKKLTKFFPPTMAVITGITFQHQAIFGNIQNIIKAKSELLSALKPNANIFYNYSDQNVKQMVKPYSNQNLISTQSSSLKTPKVNSQAKLNIKLNSSIIQTQITGLHYFSNLQLATLVASHLKLTSAQIKSQIESFTPTTEFINTHKTKKGFTIIIDDKTANPAGFEAAIDLIASIKTQTKFIISSGIVDLGQDSQKIHSNIAKKIRSSQATLLHTSDLHQDLFQTTLKSQYSYTPDLDTFTKYLAKHSKQGSIILIEGKIPFEMQKYLLSL